MSSRQAITSRHGGRNVLAPLNNNQHSGTKVREIDTKLHKKMARQKNVDKMASRSQSAHSKRPSTYLDQQWMHNLGNGLNFQCLPTKKKLGQSNSKQCILKGLSRPKL